MTLREFIEQEVKEDHVFDIEEFGTKLAYMEWEDGGKKSNLKNLRII